MLPQRGVAESPDLLEDYRIGFDFGYAHALLAHQARMAGSSAAVRLPHP